MWLGGSKVALVGTDTTDCTLLLFANTARYCGLHMLCLVVMFDALQDTCRGVVGEVDRPAWLLLHAAPPGGLTCRHICWPSIASCSRLPVETQVCHCQHCQHVAWQQKHDFTHSHIPRVSAQSRQPLSTQVTHTQMRSTWYSNSVLVQQQSRWHTNSREDMCHMFLPTTAGLSKQPSPFCMLQGTQPGRAC
jgi:hypothetical protein